MLKMPAESFQWPSTQALQQLLPKHRGNPMSKEEYYSRVIEATAKLLAKTSPEKLSYSQVAQLSGVSRPWIYKHFSNDPRSLIEHTIQSFTQTLSKISRPIHSGTLNEWIELTSQNTLEGILLLKDRPWIIQVYLRYRLSLDPIFASIRQTEVQLEKKLSQELMAYFKTDSIPDLVFGLECVRVGLWVRCLDPDFEKRYPPEALKRLIIFMTEGALHSTVNWPLSSR